MMIACRAERLLDLPDLAPAVILRRDAVGNGAHPVVEERRVDEPRPDVERIDDLVGEVVEAPALIGVDDAVAVVVRKPW